MLAKIKASLGVYHHHLHKYRDANAGCNVNTKAYQQISGAENITICVMSAEKMAIVLYISVKMT